MSVGSDRGTPARLARQIADASRKLGADFIVVGSVRAIAPTSESADSLARPTLHADAAPRTPSAIVAPPTPKAEQLDAIRARYLRDEPHKAFNTRFTNVVFGEGSPDAQVMFVGEAPGEEEDRTGRPFVGPAGQLLNKMIAAMGLSRESVYIANVLKTRPINNATPTPDQALACAPYLYDQIRAVSPRVIVSLGLPATHLLLSTSEPMSRLRGLWWQWRDPRPELDPVQIRVMPTYHPAYVLRNNTVETRAKVWSDLQQVMELLGLRRPEADRS